MTVASTKTQTEPTKAEAPNALLKGGLQNLI